MTEFHEKLIKENKLQGIEIVNDVTYSDEALQIALDYNLTIMGSSDIHGLVDWEYDVPKGGHRPVTLVFAKEKTEKSLKEALFEKRTVVFFNNMLIGREEFLKPLIDASLEVKSAEYNETWAGTTNVALVMIENKSDAPLILKNSGSINFHDHGEIVVLEPNFITELRVKPLDHLEEFELKFEVLSAVTAPKTHPEITLKVVIEEKE
jgi:3',5'-nucleoside bisphosphate phosphatase